MKGYNNKRPLTRENICIQWVVSSALCWPGAHSPSREAGDWVFFIINIICIYIINHGCQPIMDHHSAGPWQTRWSGFHWAQLILESLNHFARFSGVVSTSKLSLCFSFRLLYSHWTHKIWIPRNEELEPGRILAARCVLEVKLRA